MLQVIESGVVIMKSQGKEPSDACMERAWISFDAMAFGQDPYHLPNSSATRLEHIGIENYLEWYRQLETPKIHDSNDW